MDENKTDRTRMVCCSERKSFHADLNARWVPRFRPALFVYEVVRKPDKPIVHLAHFLALSRIGGLVGMGSSSVPFAQACECLLPRSAQAEEACIMRWLGSRTRLVGSRTLCEALRSSPEGLQLRQSCALLCSPEPGARFHLCEEVECLLDHGLGACFRRIAMTGLFGLLSISSTGAKLKFTPSEASSVRVVPPTLPALSPHERV
jgi:hypothetical protein